MIYVGFFRSPLFIERWAGNKTDLCVMSCYIQKHNPAHVCPVFESSTNNWDSHYPFFSISCTYQKTKQAVHTYPQWGHREVLILYKKSKKCEGSVKRNILIPIGSHVVWLWYKKSVLNKRLCSLIQFECASPCSFCLDVSEVLGLASSCAVLQIPCML